MKHNYLIGYDIADQRRLAKVAKVLEGFGVRIQYSFFHCYISERQKKQMKERLKKVIHEDEDQIIILPVTESQLEQIEFIGFKINISMDGVILV